MKKLFNIKPFLLLMVLIVTQSCFIGKSVERSKARKAFTIKNHAIPPNFGKEPTTLLIILRDRKGYNKWVKKAVKNNYFGEYVFVTREDLEKEEYKNTTKYRYLFDYADGSKRQVTATNSSGISYPTTITFKQYFIMDLKTNFVYKSGAEFSYFSEAMKAYFENLEATRKTNAQ